MNKIVELSKESRDFGLIQINDLYFKIIEVDKIDNEDDTIISKTEYIEQKILILKSLSNEQKEKTLRHELTHAFLWAYGFGQIKEFPLETVCEIIGIYSKDIVSLAYEYLYPKK